ncbi:hypothetical protein HYALB_00000288, partial [Hymenoscyphus albidus]
MGLDPGCECGGRCWVRKGGWDILIRESVLVLDTSFHIWEHMAFRSVDCYKTCKNSMRKKTPQSKRMYKTLKPRDSGYIERKTSSTRTFCVYNIMITCRIESTSHQSPAKDKFQHNQPAKNEKENVKMHVSYTDHHDRRDLESTIRSILQDSWTSDTRVDPNRWFDVYPETPNPYHLAPNMRVHAEELFGSSFYQVSRRALEKWILEEWIFAVMCLKIEEIQQDRPTSRDPTPNQILFEIRLNRHCNLNWTDWVAEQRDWIEDGYGLPDLPVRNSAEDF